MVTIRRAQQQVQQDALRGVQTDLTVTPSQLGSDVGRGARELAGDLAGIEAKERREQERIAEQARRQAERSRMTKFQTDLSALSLEKLRGTEDAPGGYLATEREAAQETFSGTVEDWQLRAKNLLGELPTQYQQIGQDMLTKNEESFLSTVQRHNATQFQRAQTKALNDSVDNANRQAVIDRVNPNAVIHHIGTYAQQIRLQAETEAEKKEAEERIQQEMGKTYTGVIDQLLKDGNLDMAKVYLDDFFVTDRLEPATHERFNDHLERMTLARDADRSAIEITGQAAEERDLSDTNLNNELDKINEQFAGEENATEREKRSNQLKARWQDARRRQELEDREVLSDFKNDLNRGITLGDATRRVENAHPDLQQRMLNEVARTTFPGQRAPSKNETANDQTVEQNQLVSDIRDAINAGYITSPEDLNAKYGNDLTSSSFNKLANLFEPGAAGERQKKIAADVKAAVNDLYPEMSDGERKDLVEVMTDIYDITLGSADPDPKTARGAVQTYQLYKQDKARRLALERVDTTAGVGFRVADAPEEVAGFETIGEVVDSGSLTGSTVVRQEVLPEAGTTEHFIRNFGNIRATEIPQESVDDVNRIMQERGLDPAIHDPLTIYHTEIQGLPALGVGRFDVAAKTRARRFLFNTGQDRAIDARRELAAAEVRNHANSMVFEASDGSVLRGSPALFADLDQKAKNNVTPNWLDLYLSEQGQVRNRRTDGSKLIRNRGEFVSATELYQAGFNAASDKGKFIRDTGYQILDGVLSNGQR